ncbi:MAG: hypothetical protein V9F01_02245 [Chitinophagaceae bacterium]
MEEKDIFETRENKSLLSAFAWWEKKRIIYNAVVGASGIYILFSEGLELTIIDFIGIIVYGTVANIFYCLGFLIEVGAKHYFKSEKDFSKSRNALFWAGLVFSVLITLWLGSISSMPVQH